MALIAEPQKQVWTRQAAKRWRRKPIVALGSNTNLARLAAGLSPPRRYLKADLKGQQGHTILQAVKIPEWGVNPKAVSTSTPAWIYGLEPRDGVE